MTDSNGVGTSVHAGASIAGASIHAGAFIDAMPVPGYLLLEPDPVLTFLHPAEGSRRDTAVLICPPFGWEEMCSYRARRNWARALAAAGYPTARFDFPSSGDSAGNPGGPGRVEAWTDAVGAVAAWLRERSGCERVAAIGIGLGGLIAYYAATRDAPLDDLLLWGVPANGRLLLRELRTYSSVVAARNPADTERTSLPDGAYDLIGFLMTAETTEALEAIKLTELRLPRAQERRVLLLGRDGLSPDKRLRAHLDDLGTEIIAENTADFVKLMSHPQLAETPSETIARSIAWLGEGSERRPLWAGNAVRVPAEADTAELKEGEETIRETVLTLRLEHGETFGVLTEPVSATARPVTGVLLNGGALRHTGPNRSSVETARRWAARGVASVRFDLGGIGDAGGNERELVSNAALYAQHSTDEVLRVLTQLAERGLPERFVLGGLCSAGYWSLHAALADPRIAGAVMINLYSFYWSEALVAERDTFESLDALRGRAFRRVLRGQVTADHLKTAIQSVRPSRIRRGGRHPVERAQLTEIERALDQLRDQDTLLLLLLSQGELLHDQLRRQGQLASLERWPNLVVERIPSRDHMFRALWLQARVREEVDTLLERVLVAAEASAAER
ncbi:MAG TPA: hypothetical protein VGI87_17585 [Solirubrobacteraceae bacterium]